MLLKNGLAALNQVLKTVTLRVLQIVATSGISSNGSGKDC